MQVILSGLKYLAEKSGSEGAKGLYLSGSEEQDDWHWIGWRGTIMEDESDGAVNPGFKEALKYLPQLEAEWICVVSGVAQTDKGPSSNNRMAQKTVVRYGIELSRTWRPSCPSSSPSIHCHEECP